MRLGAYLNSLFIFFLISQAWLHIKESCWRWSMLMPHCMDRSFDRKCVSCAHISCTRPSECRLTDIDIHVWYSLVNWRHFMRAGTTGEGDTLCKSNDSPWSLEFVTTFTVAGPTQLRNSVVVITMPTNIFHVYWWPGKIISRQKMTMKWIFNKKDINL